MKLVLLILSILLTTACASTSNNVVPGNPSSETLLESTASWDGEGFTYPDGEAQITISRVKIPKGARLPMHCHPVPLGGYLVKGLLEVQKEDGSTFLLKKDEPLIEVSMQWHYGRALEDTEILVIYSGASGIPVTLLKDSDSELVAKCH